MEIDDKVDFAGVNIDNDGPWPNSTTSKSSRASC